MHEDIFLVKKNSNNTGKISFVDLPPHSSPSSKKPLFSVCVCSDLFLYNTFIQQISIECLLRARHCSRPGDTHITKRLSLMVSHSNGHTYIHREMHNFNF